MGHPTPNLADFARPSSTPPHFSRSSSHCHCHCSSAVSSSSFSSYPWSKNACYPLLECAAELAGAARETAGGRITQGLVQPVFCRVLPGAAPRLGSEGHLYGVQQLLFALYSYVLQTINFFLREWAMRLIKKISMLKLMRAASFSRQTQTGISHIHCSSR